MSILNRLFILLFISALFISSSIYGQEGLRAEYFNDVMFKEHALTRIEPRPYFNYYLQSPAPGVNKEYFSVRWTGKIIPPFSGEYNFFVRADDGVRIWIDNKKIIDAWRDQEAANFSGSTQLEKGKPYDIRIEYYNGPLHAVFMLSWEQPDDTGYTFMGFTFFKTKTPVPTSVFLVDPDTEQVVKLEKKVETAAGETRKDPPLRKTPVKASTQPVQKKRVTTESSIATNEPIELKSVVFEKTRFDLQEASYKELNALIEYLKGHPKLKIKIVGHTDYAGDSTANYLLSEQRAKAVADYLKTNGIVQQRIAVVAMGCAQPKIVHELAHERGENRRVEFILVEE